MGGESTKWDLCFAKPGLVVAKGMQQVNQRRVASGCAYWMDGKKEKQIQGWQADVTICTNT